MPCVYSAQTASCSSCGWSLCGSPAWSRRVTTSAPVTTTRIDRSASPSASPDSPAASRCTGACAVYWPPVTGTPAAGPGVTTGKLGTIKRPGGTTQATYDGHPLYTYIGDNAPGQARGNKLDLNGGYWYEVRA